MSLLGLLKLLIVIGSYVQGALKGENQAVRETWLTGCPYPHVFVHSGEKRDGWLPDELFTGTPDDYFEYMQMNRASMQYALDQGFDYIFHCDRDTYARPENFAVTRFEHYDYMGYPLSSPNHPGLIYGSGGAGCFFSRKAMQAIVDSTVHDPYGDIAVGMALADAGIPLWHNPRMMIWRVPMTKQNGMVSCHLSLGTRNYDPAWMREVHQEWMNS